ncbi:3-isopropylmalate dehydratase small subunit [Mesosutterella sp. OilRF-GAM-744-9]|uniref:3-isopropylmalate dehydratase small subunit n=1 Tax=Mesosutterella porci TaxID=2915351 RepID=A0ABS9MPF0_9BURK|nr:3-isopropylmalate dehydratase small subunit [Mesosutterella sp. oilRF-744-WT-GAM-9]MCG5030214.1 3-isopropylmalate dehydratase small subunit [Mesosutterella sp. oilRF-744-WT-GAM-9]MCI6530003.1 3-isopropylmalate dehydratase small subunit [Mesosutterella sp.]
MEKLVTVESVALPLPIDNLDTDQIMPKQFLRGIDKKGLDRGAFYDLRFNPDGSPRPGSVFNRPEYRGSQIIVSRPNFGCGSSREHAVWGTLQLGFRVVIAPSFGEIFYSNCFNNGLLAARVSPEDGDELLRLSSGCKPAILTVDVEKREIRCGDRKWSFLLSERHRTMLLEGLDLVGATLKKDLQLIEDFRRRHEQEFPWMARLAGKRKVCRGSQA